MSLLGHALVVGFDFEIKISFHVTSARPPQGSVECVVAGSCARVGYLPCPLVEQASPSVSLLGHVHAFVLDFEIKIFRYSLP